MTKRGQITIFIIIGIIILLLIAIIFFFRGEEAQFRPKTPIEQKLGPVELYIQSCIEKIGEEAVQKMGQSGGYVYLPADVDLYPAGHVTEDRFGLLKVPLWYYNDRSYMPSIDEMQYQISLFLNNSIKKCLNNFEPLKNEYQINEKGAPVFTVTIADEDVVIETEYPLDVVLKAREESYKVQKFSTVIPVRLKKAYSLARAVFEQENRMNFFENMTMQLMSVNPDIPFTGMEFRCSNRQWDINTIKSDIQRSIAANIQRVRFKNTNYVPFQEPESEYKKFIGMKFDPKTGEVLNMPKRLPPVDLYEYAHFFFDVGADAKDLTIDTIYYREWPISIKGIPNDMGILKSEKMSGLSILKFLCIETWHFVYDISYNLEFAIRDDESFGGKGYTFKFAMPVIIYHNRASKKPLSARIFTNPVAAPDVCTNLGGDERDIMAYDMFTREQLSRVNISYQCLGAYCSLGRTKGDSGINRLRTKLPEGCVNPKITAEKEDYLTGEVFASKSGIIEIPMVPLKKYDFNVTKVLSINKEEAPLLADEVVLISIKNQKYNFEQNIVYPDITESNLSRLSLIYDPATYEVDIFLSKGSSYVGGWTGNWTVSPKDLFGTDLVNFKVYEKIPYPSTDEEIIEMLSEVSAESNNYMPQFGVKNE
jgi:hypothetical protein